MRRVCLLCALLASACGGELPPWAEAVLVVDTDLPVPRVATRLRIDLYALDGRWFESRDLARPDPRDWPVSFSVWSDDEHNDAYVWVRLRLYPEGRVRDYLGERFWDWTAPIDDPLPTFEPRLWVDGRDATPPLEPQPLVTVDRLLLVQLEPGKRGRIPVMLHGACAGTMPRLSADRFTPVPGEAQSCVDTEKQRRTVSSLSVDDDAPPPAPVLDGIDCGPSETEDRVCIPGGATVLGSSELTLYDEYEPFPERVVIHRPFFVDRHEVSVARFRAALAAGFAPPALPLANEGPLGSEVDIRTCTWSDADRGREGFALTCVTWATARAFCQYAGGDLPTEAQWEHMATLAVVDGRSRYPWGDEPPTCERASYGRLALATVAGVCQHEGMGPETIAEGSALDVTVQGAVGVAGGVSEWMLDGFDGYRSECWAQSPVHEPRCQLEQPLLRPIRGASWAAPPTFLPGAVRFGVDAEGSASVIGFRCAYPVEEP